jgi:signal transduction histidine kinase
MWFGTSTGVWRLDDPRAASPAFQQYGVAQGLSSSLVHSLTGDDFGRIYVGTGIGLDRLDPAKGRIENFSATDGFPSSFVQASYRDRYGNIWLAGRHGVWRLTPTEGPVRGKPLRALVTSIKVRGIERPISSAGETELSGLTLASDQDQIELAFAAPQYHGSAKPLYQYRLEGSRSSEWSALSTIHSVHFASLAPGRYRFQVRAADARTREAAPPSTIEFRLLPPLWLTWWFQLGVVLLVAACIYALYRYRLRLMLEREQLRMSIATDLHDDIGSSLTRIAIWSEVAAQDAARAGTALPAPLAQVGTVSRELVDSMSDIVWAVNPRHDRFTDLASRMRRYVGNLESAASPRVTFEVQDQGWDIEAGAAVRREVFLIFKEALNNVLRHSGCANCRALLTLDAAGIILLVRDDGSGFEPETCPRGNGLDSMARRARRVGGILRIDACPGQGTSVELRIPGSARRRSTKPTWMGGAPSDGFR